LDVGVCCVGGCGGECPALVWRDVGEGRRRQRVIFSAAFLSSEKIVRKREK